MCIHLEEIRLAFPYRHLELTTVQKTLPREPGKGFENGFSAFSKPKGTKVEFMGAFLDNNKAFLVLQDTKSRAEINSPDSYLTWSLTYVFRNLNEVLFCRIP